MLSIFIIYCPSSDGVLMANWIVKIDVIQHDYVSVSIHVRGMKSCDETDEENRYCYDFSIAYLSTQIVFPI